MKTKIKATGLFVSSWCISLVFLLGDPNEVVFWNDEGTQAFNITSDHMTFSRGINVTEAGMNAYNSGDFNDIIFEDKGRTSSIINGKLSILHVDILGSELDNVNLTIINKNGITFGPHGAVCGVNKLTLSAKNTEGANGAINLQNMDGALFDTRRGHRVEIVVQDFSRVVPNVKGLPVNTSWIVTHDIVEVDYFFDDDLRQDQFPEIYSNKVKQRGQYDLWNWGLITEESHARKTDINLPVVNAETVRRTEPTPIVPVTNPVRRTDPTPTVNVERPVRRTDPTPTVNVKKPAEVAHLPVVEPVVNVERSAEQTNTSNFEKEMSSIKSLSDSLILSYNNINEDITQNFAESLNIERHADRTNTSEFSSVVAENAQSKSSSVDVEKEVSSIKSFSDVGISSYNEVNKVTVQNFDEFLNIADLDSSCFSSKLLEKMSSSNASLQL